MMSISPGEIGEEFKDNPLFEIIFHMIYTDLEKIFADEVNIKDVIDFYALAPYTKAAVILISKSLTEKHSIWDAATSMGLDLENWNDWTIAYAADVFVTINNPTINI
jgi:hypothetical protein